MRGTKSSKLRSEGSDKGKQKGEPSVTPLPGRHPASVKPRTSRTSQKTPISELESTSKLNTKTDLDPLGVLGTSKTDRIRSKLRRTVSSITETDQEESEDFDVPVTELTTGYEGREQTLVPTQIKEEERSPTLGSFQAQLSDDELFSSLVPLLSEFSFGNTTPRTQASRSESPISTIMPAEWKPLYTWERNAPSFKGDVHELLDYFDHIKEYAEVQKVVDDKEKKKLLCKFADRMNRQVWQALDEYEDDSVTYDDFVEAIKLKYPEIMYQERMSVKELIEFTNLYVDVGITEMPKIAALERQFGVFIKNLTGGERHLVSNKQLCDLWLGCFDKTFKMLIMNRVDNTRFVDDRLEQVEKWAADFSNKQQGATETQAEDGGDAAAPAPARLEVPKFAKAVGISRTDEDPVPIRKLMDYTVELATQGSAPYRGNHLQDGKEAKLLKVKNEKLDKKLQEIEGIRIKMEDSQSALMQRLDEAVKAAVYRATSPTNQPVLPRQTEYRNTSTDFDDAANQRNTGGSRDTCYHCGQQGHMARNCSTRQRQLDEGIIYYKYEPDGKRRLVLKDGAAIPREPLSQWPAERIEALKSRLEVGKASANFLAQAEEYGHEYSKIVPSGTRGMFFVAQPNDSGYVDNRASLMNTVQGGLNGAPFNVMTARSPMMAGQFMQQPLQQGLQFMQQPLQQGSQFMPVPTVGPPFDNNMNGLQNYNSYIQPQAAPQFMNQQMQQMPMQQQMMNQMHPQNTSQGMLMQGQPQFTQQQIPMQQGGQQFPQMMTSMPQQSQMGAMQGFQMQNQMMPQFMQQNPMGMMNAMQQYPASLMNTMQQQMMNPLNLQTRSGKTSASGNDDEGFQDDQ